MSGGGVRRHRGAFVVLGAALIALSVAGFARWRTGNTAIFDGQTSERSELARAVGARRILQPRLTGFDYGPSPAATESRKVSSAAIRLAIARLEQRYHGDDRPEHEAAWATALLVTGDTAAAIALFDSVSSRAIDDAGIWNDAAAAYLTAASELGWHELWVRGLDAAERAFRGSSRLPEAAYNRAFALEGLHLHAEAASAWREYLALDQDSPWAAEARRRHLTLASRAAGDRVAWQRIEQELDARLPLLEAADETSVMPFRQELRLWIEQELIPAWANEALAGSADAVTALERVKAAATLLERTGGDPLPLLSMNRASELSVKAPGRARLLASAHLTFLGASRLSDGGQHERASAEAAAAYPLFLKTASPYSAYGPAYAGIASYMARQLDAARATFASMETSSSPILTGRREWMLGLIALNQNRLHEARGHYTRALRRFESAGEKESVAQVSALLAETCASLGDLRSAWRHQRVALEYIPHVRVQRRTHLILQLGALLSLKSDDLRSALAFQDAVIASGRSAGENGASLVEGYLHRARTYARTERSREAEADLASARELLPSVASATVGRALAAEIDAAVAEIATSFDPSSAIAAATRALEHYQGRSGDFRSTGLYLQRGRAQRAAGHPSRARADFLAAIERFEHLRENVHDRSDRVRLFRDGWNAFSEMVRLAVADGADAAGALEFAERARARTLLESLMGHAARPKAITEVVRDLPAGTAALFYSSQPDRLWIWVVTRGGVRFVERALPLPELQFRVRRIERLAVSDRTAAARQGEALRTELRRLFVELVAPVRDVLAEVDTLAIVPDGPLHRLPFAALIDPETGAFLVETHIIATAPSLTTFVRAAAAPADGPRLALVVADPTTDPEAGRAPLPFARQEAEHLASLYDGAKVLTRDKATRAAFLEHLPRADVVHYAGHASIDPDEPDRSNLWLSPALEDPSGLLWAHDLRGAILGRQPVVVLAACSSNRGRIEMGEGVFSLARPFLEAGASDVVATLWDVEDRASAVLFTRLHEKLVAGVPAARALALVQREILAAAGPDRPGLAAWAWPVTIGARVRGGDSQTDPASGDRR